MITNFLFNFTYFCVFFTKLLTSGILFSTAVNAELVAKPVILGILLSISVILVFKSVFLTKLLKSGILFSTAVNSFLVAAPPNQDTSFANFIISVGLTKSSVSEIFLSVSLFFLSLIYLYDI